MAETTDTVVQLGKAADILRDSFGRRFSYLRLSVTDACNFRCVYCLPDGYRKPAGQDEPLSLAEIRNLVAAFAEMGTHKVRLTGGEPMIRRDLLEIVRAVAGTPGIRKVALSTNGHLLRERARQLRAAGVDAVNVSVDSLDRKNFAEITGTDRLDEVFAGIDAALEAGFSSVKVNAVLMAGWNDGDLEAFMEWARRAPIGIRFIELMPTFQNRELFERRHLKAETIRARLLERGWAPRARGETDGPAIEFAHPDYRGRIGLIAPYARDFCASCNRLRVTSQGKVRLCLFAEGEHSIRHLLQDSSQKERLKAELLGQLQRKEVSHYLPEGIYGNNRTFSAMGG